MRAWLLVALVVVSVLAVAAVGSVWAVLEFAFLILEIMSRAA